MATKADITLRRGRTTAALVVVNGMADWTDITAKFFAAREKGHTLVIDLEGTIIEVDDTLVFEFQQEHTLDLTEGNYYYEVALYRANGDFIKDVVYGTLTVEKTVKPNPME